MLSVIVPVLNESQSLRPLYEELVSACEEHGINFEAVFVDDGSTDGSWPMIEGLAASDERVAGIRLRRNFGKAAALTAGMRAVRGDRILMMDADLQDDPAEVPRLLARLDDGFDVVNGWKQKRRDPWHKVYPSRVFNWLVGCFSGLKLHDHNCGLKLFRAEVASEIQLYGELHRFIPVLAHARGFRVTELPVKHRERKYGRSKYGLRRFVRGFLDLLTVTFLTGFGQRPQHLLGTFGLVLFGLGSVGLGYLALLWMLMNGPLLLGLEPLIEPVPIGERPLLAYSAAALLLGAQALSLGLLAELLVAYAGRDIVTYSVAERTGRPTPDREAVDV